MAVGTAPKSAASETIFDPTNPRDSMRSSVARALRGHIRARHSGHVTDPSSVLDPEPSSVPQAVPSVMMSTR